MIQTCFMIFSWWVGRSSIGMSSRSKWELFIAGIPSSSSAKSVAPPTSALAPPTSLCADKVGAEAITSLSSFGFFSGGGSSTCKYSNSVIECLNIVTLHHHLGVFLFSRRSSVTLCLLLHSLNAAHETSDIQPLQNLAEPTSIFPPSPSPLLLLPMSVLTSGWLRGGASTAGTRGDLCSFSAIYLWVIVCVGRSQSLINSNKYLCHVCIYMCMYMYAILYNRGFIKFSLQVSKTEFQGLTFVAPHACTQTRTIFNVVQHSFSGFKKQIFSQQKE